jgi:hypothetical protein
MSTAPDPAWPFCTAAVPAGPAGVSCTPGACTAPGDEVPAAGLPAAGDAGEEVRAGAEDAGDVPRGAVAEPVGADVAGRLAVGVLDVGVPAVGTGDGVAVGAGLELGGWVAAMAGRRAEGTAETEAEADGLAPGLPLPAASGFLSRFWPGASSRASADWPFSGTTTGREAVSTAGAAGSPGSAVPSLAWDAWTPVDRTSTAPIAAAAAPRRIPPWIPVRDIESSDLC